MATSLVWGSWNVICDVCGFKFKAYQLRKRWDGKMVCKDDWEIRHPQDLIKIPKDDQSVPWSRPEQTDVFADVNYEMFGFTPTTANNSISTPDSAAISITGDLEIRTKLAVTNGSIFYNKMFSGNDRSYRVSFFNPKFLLYEWSVDGTVGTMTSIFSTGSVPYNTGVVIWIRVTHDVDNGAGGNDVIFYTSIDGIVWTQLGAKITTAGVTSIFDSVGLFRLGNSNQEPNSIYYADLRNGIGGPIVMMFDPSNDCTDVTATSFTSSTGEVWTINQSGTPHAELRYANMEDPIPSGNFTTNNGTF